ncbi:MAG: hypothetical protein A2527_00340 [Candidatus Lambdaproteobacteria bacterium RIFOXYD2_FULL_50_16]|uniref:histidine kinase n=1 Tax=Candidatus Lambdaproteobacteria bacterium RIFOXYD2_FULL_50_16 TaxID=1817772 RepID=A0A1F6GFH2_9PROT|nr:MAG: hypothetical protein A2527_00340 [Candidatus Lambdaproteobacteria bacterium RIFOXYD2_FULL_50_16]
MNKFKYDEALVLIVDDTLRNIQVLGSILKTEGFQVAVAQNGRQAIDAAAKLLPDLILLDVMMPEMDGFEACSHLKSDPITSQIPVIFLTAKVETEDIIKGFALGAVDYITKPFNAIELLVRVKNHLEITFSRREIAKQNEERKELLHILCHDLANSFGSILSFLSLDIADLSENIEGFSKIMQSSAENGLGLIEMVRKMRAIEEGKFQVELKPFKASDLVARSLMILESKIKAKGILVEVKIERDLMIMVEPLSFVNSVFNNLITNAIKFSKPNGIIQVLGEIKEREVLIQINDQGIGIPRVMVNQLFDISKSTSRLGTSGETGTGFGMPLVQKFVGLYNGRIEVKSKDHQDYPNQSGTQIKLFLPLVSQLD